MAVTLLQVGLAFATVGLTVTIHLIGLSRIVRLLVLLEGARDGLSLTTRMSYMGVVVCCLFALHLVEIGVYAIIYASAGAVPPFDSALYFSAVTFTTIGYGDVTVEGPWRLFAALEGLTGIILVSWSAAFLVAVIRRLDLWRTS